MKAWDPQLSAAIHSVCTSGSTESRDSNRKYYWIICYI